MESLKNIEGDSTFGTVVELVDTADSKSAGLKSRKGSIPFGPTGGNNALFSGHAIDDCSFNVCYG